VDGCEDGTADGPGVGLAVGIEGETVGLHVGEKDGAVVGFAVGAAVGLMVGFTVGETVGLHVGVCIGDAPCCQSNNHHTKVLRSLPHEEKELVPRKGSFAPARSWPNRLDEGWIRDLSAGMSKGTQRQKGLRNL
jgi:phage tail tape-measure protein